MGLELLREADMVLDACGRPTPPPGYKFLDLPRIMSYQVDRDTSEGGIPFAPFSQRVQNAANTMFVCNGISLSNSSDFRVKWPNGRYFQQNPQQPDGGPNGSGALCFALNEEQPVEAGGKITVDISGALVAHVTISFLGFLRYLLKDTGAANDGSLQCVIGYPAWSRSKANAGKVPVMGDPIRALEDLPRYICGPNQNVMAPEFMLGNQHTFETPPGFEDEAFNLFSDPIAVGIGDSRLGVPVLIPGNDIVIFRRWRQANVEFIGDAAGYPIAGLRLPNGFSVTGADMIPFPGTNGSEPPIASLYEWIPFFPTLGLRAGDRLIMDVGNINSSGVSGDAAIVSTFEFEGVKRRRATA